MPSDREIPLAFDNPTHFWNSHLQQTKELVNSPHKANQEHLITSSEIEMQSTNIFGLQYTKYCLSSTLFCKGENQNVKKITKGGKKI